MYDNSNITSTSNGNRASRARMLIHRRRLRRLGDAALELLWPTRCAGCERLGMLLCNSCADALPRIDQKLACPRCGAPAGHIVCTECAPAHERRTFAFTQAHCALELSELTRRIILAYKDGGERRLAPVLARILGSAVSLEWRRWANVLTWVPADPQALRRRGFDHMEHIAHELAAQIGLRAIPTLVKRARADQRSLGRAQRRENTGSLFAIRQPPPPPPPGSTARLPARVILIDDVFTTGATLDAATRALLASGAGEVRAATIARVW
ncbi:MAG: double zinc ribbon domain-containing protein [Coriobacteriales bacterium]|jgi:predicted amidophosphoribosyltransferase|nr:double zinc ribbon domain-containing protein [Coriobacteriales bacterium]